MRKTACLACLLLFGPWGSLFSQTLQLSSPAVVAGDFAVLGIGLKIAPGQEPAALQWDVLIPSRQLELQNERVVRLTVAAQDVGKGLICARTKTTADTQTVRCILSGGAKPIPSGTVAIMSLRVREGTPPGPVRVPFTLILGADRDAKPLMIEGAEAVVTVRAR